MFEIIDMTSEHIELSNKFYLLHSIISLQYSFVVLFVLMDG